MPPSTVFSYWRRDHRRSTAPPVSLPVPTSELKTTTDSPISRPQLPTIPDTPTLTPPFVDSQTLDVPSWNDSQCNDASKLNVNSAAALLPSSASLAIPSPLAERENRPHSSPEHEPESGLTSQLNTSQLSVSGLRPEQGDGESSSKPNSPFRLSFGKGLWNLQAPPTEPQRRSPTAGPGPSQFRLKTSPEDSPAEKTFVPPRDLRMETLTMPRVGDRDVSTEPSHPKSGKARLHLLNPMALLARRRSSQMGSSRVDDAKISTPDMIPAIPDDYDPRIRGNIVHDFSAPRPRRNVSWNTAVPPDGITSVNAQENRWNDQTKRHSDHSPVFKEHFEDDQKVLQVENKGYLQSSLLTNPTQHGYEKSIPVFARKLPSYAPDHPPRDCGAECISNSRSPCRLASGTARRSLYKYSAH